MRKGGLEPPRAAPPAPKAGASTNSATFASCSRRRQTNKYSRSCNLPPPIAATGGAISVRISLFAAFSVKRVSVGHYENFPVASKMVPARYRGAIMAIYRFARATDDIADEGDGDVAARLAALEPYRNALDVIERGGTPTLLADLALAVRAHALPLAPFRDLLSAFTQDVTVKRYATFADLLDYCRRSANPIGRLVLAVYGVPAVAQSPALFAASDAICTALQLTNFWQDIAADYQRGRVYVPQEDMARFNYPEADLAKRQYNEHFLQLMQFEASRAREFFSRAVAELPAEDRRAMAPAEIMASIYRALLRRIELDKFRVFEKEYRLSKPEKAGRITAQLFKSFLNWPRRASV